MLQFAAIIFLKVKYQGDIFGIFEKPFSQGIIVKCQISKFKSSLKVMNSVVV